ncbi:MAG: Calx-beta domain-containing protein [Planctomycetaceae bacterium]
MMNRQRGRVTHPFSQFLARLKSGSLKSRRQRKSAIHRQPVEIDVLESRLLLSAVTVSTDDIQSNDITITAADDSATDDLTIEAGVTVESTGGGGTVTLNAGDNFVMTATSLVKATTAVVVNLDAGNTDAGTGSTATLDGVFDAPSVQISGDSDDETINLSPAAFSVSPLTIDGGSGSDVLNFDLTGVTAPVWTFTTRTSGTLTSTSHQTVTFSDIQPSVVGAVNLSGSLNLGVGFDGTGTQGDTVVLIENDGTDAVVGQFTGLVNGASVTVNGNPNWRIAYDGGDGNDVTLEYGKAQVSISNVTVTEGDSGTAVATFTVTVDSAAGGAFQVPYASSDSTAKSADADYVPVNSTLNFTGLTAGESHTISVDVNGDAIVELDEEFLVTLTAIQNNANVQFAPGQAQAIGTITNDDASTLSIDDVSIVEGNAGTSMLTFTVTVDNAVSGGLTVMYGTSDVTANAGTDYTATSGTLTFVGTVGETQTIQVPIIGETVAELDETFNVTLSAINAGGRDVTLAKAVGIGTITDDDRIAVDLSVSTPTATETGATVVTLTATAASAVSGNQTFTVNVSGTGVDASDYVLSNATVTIADGQTEGTVTLTVQDDSLVEATEIMTVALTSPSAGVRPGPDASKTITVTDNDTATLTIADITVAETNSGTTTATFTVVSDKAVDNGFSVDFTTDDGTATTAGSDYVLNSGTLNFVGTANESHQIVVTVNGDTLVELDETFAVDLSNIVDNGRSIVLGNASATAMITNEDAAALTIDSVSLDEGTTGDTTFTFTVSLNNAVDSGFSVQVDTADGTATVADNDYVAITGGSVSFVGTASETTTIAVTVKGDTKVESDEAFQVLLSNIAAGGRNITLPTVQGTGTITNDDDPVPVNLSASTNAASEAGGTVVTLTATADSNVNGAQTVDVAVSGVSATDFLLSGVTITIPDGANTGSVTFTVMDDDLVELPETAVVTISNPSSGIAIGGTASQSISIADNDTSTISINDVTSAELNSGTATFTFNVTLTNAVDNAVAVTYTTANGTAIAGSDYTAASGTLNFAGTAGETQTVTVSVSGDELVELDENFLVNLLNITAGGRTVTFLDNQGRGTVTNDDSATLSINDITAVEGNAGTTSFTFTVTVDKAVDTPFTVDYATSDGTATAGADYVSSSGNSVAFNGTVGETQTLQITVNGDTAAEVNETFMVTLTNIQASGRSLTLSDDVGVATIEDDDGIPVSLSSDVSAGTEAGVTVVTLTATAASSVVGDQTIDLLVTGTGITSGDYTLSNATITILNGQTTGTATFTIVNDTVVEHTEVATVTLINPSLSLAVGSPSAVDITITDNDAATLSISDVTAVETAAATTFTFTVTLDNAVEGSLSVDYSTADGTATAGSDYTGVSSGTLTFAGTVGETQTVEITVTGDEVVERNETFLVNLTNLVTGGLNVTISDAQGLGTITNDDTATVSISDAQIVEGNGGTAMLTFTVTLDRAVDVGLTVDYATFDGNATVADSDYVAIPASTLTFTGIQGETRSVQVTVNGDTDIELDETFTVQLSNVVVADSRSVLIGNAVGTGTIRDDDGIPVNLSVTQSAGTEFGSTVIGLVVTASQAVSGDQTVEVMVSGTNITTGDYVLSSQTVTIADGQTSGTATFTIQNDDIVEGLETAMISIRNPSLGISLGTTTSGSVIIVSDDVISLGIEDVSLAEGDSGTSVLTFTISPDQAFEGTFTLDYATADGTATAGSDYVAASGTLTFDGATAQTQTIQVTINGDEDVEAGETLMVNLSNLLAGSLPVSITDAQAVGTITDDDGAITTNVNVSLDVAAGTEAGQTVITITATASAAVTGDQTVDVTVSGTNVTGTDYQLSGTIITILNGATTGTVTLTVVADGLLEAPLETATVTLANPSAGIVLGATPSATFTIQDNTVPVLDNVDRFPGPMPTLTWQPVPGAVRYEMWFSRVFPDGRRIVSDANITGTSWTVPQQLDAAFYRYWVRAFDANNNASAWSLAKEFEVSPTLISPLNGAFTPRPTFTWNPIPFATGYTLYIRSYSNGNQQTGTPVNTVIENIPTASYTPAADLPAGDIRWWIRASDAVGNRGWSLSGLTGVKPRAVVTGPASPTTDTTPTFTWGAIQGAGRYALYVTNMDTDEVVINNTAITATQFTPTTALATGNYRVWVKAIDGVTDDFNSGFWSLPYNLLITDNEDAQNEDDTSFGELQLLAQTQPLVQAPIRREERQQSVERETQVNESLAVPETSDALPVDVPDSELALVDALMADPLVLVGLIS